MSTLVPVAQSYLNYRGDVRDGLEVGQAMGPTTYGAVMYVVGWEYDEAADMTRVGMSAVRPEVTP